MSKHGALRVTFPWLYTLSRFVPLPLFRSAAETVRRTVSYNEQSLARYKRLVAADPDNAPVTLFRKLFQAGEEGLSDEGILSEARSYIIAGSDTTSNTLTYLV
ncbi:cytochrome P450 [Candidatus Bathyarchaeota archaeon]|nr:cytochrome P450 [Candidatus Bathyarchaeota archaeon]